MLKNDFQKSLKPSLRNLEQLLNNDFTSFYGRLWGFIAISQKLYLKQLEVSKLPSKQFRTPFQKWGLQVSWVISNGCNSASQK